METNGRYYSYKKNEGNGYDENLKMCIEKTCQFCLKMVLMFGRTRKKQEQTLKE